MTNREKFKTAEERADAFYKWCAVMKGETCHMTEGCNVCPFRWLDLEYKEEILPCPFCGSEVRECLNFDHSLKRLRCVCGYSSEWVKRGEDHSSHNRVARVVMKEKKGAEE